MARYTTDTDLIASAKKISWDHLKFISAPRDFDGIGKCLWYLCVLLISDPDAADGFVCRLTFRQSLTLDWTQYNPQSELAQSRNGVMREKWRWAEQSAYLFKATLSSPQSLCGPCLLLGTRCVLCQQSLMANFSKFSPNHLSSPNFYLLTTETLSNSGQLLDHCWPQGGIDQLSSHSNNFKINIFIMPGEIVNNADWLP